jgi:hypothetical protein
MPLMPVPEFPEPPEVDPIAGMPVVVVPSAPDMPCIPPLAAELELAMPDMDELEEPVPEPELVPFIAMLGMVVDEELDAGAMPLIDDPASECVAFDVPPIFIPLISDFP